MILQIKTATFFPSKVKKLGEEVIDIGRVPDFETFVKDCKLPKIILCDKNVIDSGWLFWCHNYALGYLLKTNSETLEVIINFDDKT